jgi:hypothetical protein
MSNQTSIVGQLKQQRNSVKNGGYETSAAGCLLRANCGHKYVTLCSLMFLFLQVEVHMKRDERCFGV